MRLKFSITGVLLLKDTAWMGVILFFEQILDVSGFRGATGVEFFLERFELEPVGAGGEAGELRGGVGGGLFGRGLPGLGVAQFAAGLIEVVAPLA